MSQGGLCVDNTKIMACLRQLRLDIVGLFKNNIELSKISTL